MPVKITESTFGKTKDGVTVKSYQMSSEKGGRGLVVELISLGASIRSLNVPDKDGCHGDVVTGFDTVAEYEDNVPKFGCICGRVANRISGGRFTLDGHDHQLAVNDAPRPNHLHGGNRGLNTVVFDSHIDEDRVVMMYVSPDGDEGYPGQLTTVCYFQLDEDNNELLINFTATTDKPTPVNLINHAYINLAGHDKGDIRNHFAQVNAEQYTPFNDNYIPTGDVVNVGDTPPVDLRKSRRLGDVIDDVPGGIGFNIQYLTPGDDRKHVGRVNEPTTGRILDVFSDQPSVILYTAFYAEGTRGKGGYVHPRYCGVCLETGLPVDAINQPGIGGSSILRPGETYVHKMWLKFSTSSS